MQSLRQLHSVRLALIASAVDVSDACELLRDSAGNATSALIRLWATAFARSSPKR